jgi:hypothetical protein
MTVLVRQVMLAGPLSDLFRLAVRSSVAILPAAITLVQKPLVVALQLVVQDDATHSATLLAQTLFGALVAAIDLRVVRLLPWLPETCVEHLARLPGAFLLAPIRFEQVSAPIAEYDGAII